MGEVVRELAAIIRASFTSVASLRLSIAQPTTRLEYWSSTTQQ